MELGFSHMSQGSGERSEKFQNYLSDMLQDDFIKNTSPFSDAASSPFLRINKEFFKEPAEKDKDNIFDQTADIFLTDEDFAEKTQLNKVLAVHNGTDLYHFDKSLVNSCPISCANRFDTSGFFA